MKSNRVVIWGASGHALVVADIIKMEQKYHIVGFLDDQNPERKNTKFCGLPILGGAEELDTLLGAGITNLVLAFGDCTARLRISEICKNAGFQLITPIHPKAVIADDVRIGEGTVVVAGVIINPGVSIGNNVIVNTAASIDHECIIEDGVHIGPGVRLGGKVSIGAGTWIGIGSIISDHIRIGKNSVIGAASLVLNDVPSGVVAFGSPAMVKKGLNNEA